MVATQIRPDARSLLAIKDAITNKTIKAYANTTDQLALLSSTNVTHASEHFLIADDDGYNSGNSLLGLHCQFVFALLVDDK